MLRSSFVIALLAAAAIAAPVLAQTASCADEVKKLQDSPEMKVQGGINHQASGRTNAAVYAQQAAAAAAQNDEKRCREYLDRAKLALTF